MFKNFFLRKILKSQLKGIPEAQQEKLITIIEKNPEFFRRVAEETQEKVKQGKDQQSAMMEVMQAHEEEFKRVMK
jgi:hypothetical protein